MVSKIAPSQSGREIRPDKQKPGVRLEPPGFVSDTGLVATWRLLRVLQALNSQFRIWFPRAIAAIDLLVPPPSRPHVLGSDCGRCRRARCRRGRQEALECFTKNRIFTKAASAYYNFTPCTGTYSAPLVALPIVLLFLFVGCNAFLGLDDKVFDANGWLHLGTFTDTSDIKSIEISIGFTLDNTRKSPTNLRAGITMSGAQIAALLNSGGWPGLSLDLTAQPDGVLGDPRGGASQFHQPCSIRSVRRDPGRGGAIHEPGHIAARPRQAVDVPTR